jgi:hypothetical protein
MAESRRVGQLVRDRWAHAGSRWLAWDRSARGMQRRSARAGARGLRPVWAHAGFGRSDAAREPLAHWVDWLAGPGGPMGPMHN